MEPSSRRVSRIIASLRVCIATAMLPVCLAGCTGTAGPGGQTADNSSTTGDPVFLDDPLSFDGSVSGKLLDSQSTRTSTTTTDAAQEAPPEFDTQSTTVRFFDLAGNELLDGQGQPLAEAPLNPDGSFEADNLPVGVDFTVCGDIGNDGVCDIESLIHIPAGADGVSGQLENTNADPLTTTVLARLRQAIEERDLSPDELPFSPVSVVTRVADAYTHLFEESGVDQAVTLDGISLVDRSDLGDLFEQLVPPTARTGMDIAEGSIELSRAADAEALALRVAEVFLRAGFPIADLPEGPDLSFLAELPDVAIASREELMGPGGSPPPDEFVGELEDMAGDALTPELLEQLQNEFGGDFSDATVDDLPPELLAMFPDGIPEDFFLQVAQAGDGGLAPASADTIYVSTVVEPNRNFAFEEGEGGVARLPVLNDFLIGQMARLQFERRTITLGDLYDLLTSLDSGLGVRLMFEVFDPNFFGPPLTIFETADGRGVAINLREFFVRLFEEGFQDLDPATIEARAAELRTLLAELLADTVAPSFERLFGAITSEQGITLDDLTRRLREARAHLPFSRSGPSAFFVVADGDPFRSETIVAPITVDVEMTTDGQVIQVTFNAAGAGAFYLGFTEATEGEGKVQFIVRETGRPLHGPRGPLRLNMTDATVFAPVDGVPFVDFVSEEGLFYPGANIAVTREEFAPASSDTLQVAGESVDGPNDQIFVLATGVGPGAEPVRVDYDFTTSVATYNPGGRNLLMFLPDSQETGEFALFNEDTGRPALLNDPSDFFLPPPDQPENFEDAFNQPDGGELLPPPPDEPLPPPPDGEQPPPDEPLPPPDGTEPPPPDGTEPPPPDGDQPPAPAQDAGGELTSDPVDMPPPPPDGEFIDPGFIRVAASSIVGLALAPEQFRHVFGTDVPNERYDPAGDPFFDDINGNGAEDPGEPTAQFRPTLFNASDWRSTDIRWYYRRADDNGPVLFEDVDFNSSTPQTLDGVALVPRNFLPRLNAFLFGRPNTAINLLTAFLPPDFFNGTRPLDRDTAVDVFSAIAVINLVMEQVLNIEADVDFDGSGPLPAQRSVVDGHIFVAPVGDPFVLLLKGFRERSATAAR